MIYMTLDFSPGRGSEQTGVRPTLVIQNNLGNQYSSTTIVAAGTSRQKKKYPFHVEFTAAESGLERDGTVLLEQLPTLDQGRLRQRRGRPPPDRTEEVNEALKQSLALP